MPWEYVTRATPSVYESVLRERAAGNLPVMWVDGVPSLMGKDSALCVPDAAIEDAQALLSVQALLSECGLQ